MLLDVVSCTPDSRATGCTLRIQAPGAAGTWNTAGTARVASGFRGEVRVPLDSGTSPLSGAGAFRLVLEGAVAVSRILLR